MVAGCAFWPRPAVVPMPVLREPAPQRAAMLVVMLPGAYSRPRDFIDEGFVQRLRAQRVAADVLIADAHLGYVENGTLLERLRDDVLVPALRDGARRIWLVGISLGGFASLGLLMRHADWIEGVLAIAPYVGQPPLLQQVRAAGGARAYAAAPARSTSAAFRIRAERVANGVFRHSAKTAWERASIASVSGQESSSKVSMISSVAGLID